MPFYEESLFKSTENDDDQSELQNTDEVTSASDTEGNLEITPGLGSLNGLASVGSEDDQSKKKIERLKHFLAAWSKSKELTVLQEITSHSATIYRETLIKTLLIK